MPEVKARLQHLASIEHAAMQALELADECNEVLIGIKFDECLQCVRDRIEDIAQQQRL